LKSRKTGTFASAFLAHLHLSIVRIAVKWTD
jgi:hypothetical protein